jgi:hypothetical protein
MKWIDFQLSSKKPIDDSWVLIQSPLPGTPKYEVCIFNSDEWYLPANDDFCSDEDIVKWAYIEDVDCSKNNNL